MIVKKVAGYSWIELILILIIFITVIMIMTSHMQQRSTQVQLKNAKQDILMLQNMLKLYKLDNGFYPTTQQGLQALTQKPTTSPIPENWKAGGYLKVIPKDPWGHTYHYTNPGQHADIDIYTYGADNKPGGVGTNGTIGNWTLSVTSSALTTN